MTATADSGKLISCLMVTQDPARFRLLDKSVACYVAQHYPDRELVICCDGPREYQYRLARYLENLSREDIRLHCPSGDMSLGAIRNYSVSVARGSYICQWDDDDLNHPRRLSVQFDHLRSTGHPVSFMRDQLHYFYDTRELYWVNWHPDFIPGTLLCRTDILASNPYPGISRDEDGQLRDALRRRMDIAGLANHGYLNVYTFHGSNTWNHAHHLLIHESHDAGYMAGHEDIVRANLKYFDLPDPVLVSSGASTADRSRD